MIVESAKTEPSTAACDLEMELQQSGEQSEMVGDLGDLENAIGQVGSV
jgi:hypothetical protein